MASTSEKHSDPNQELNINQPSPAELARAMTREQGGCAVSAVAEVSRAKVEVMRPPSLAYLGQNAWANIRL